MTVNVAAEASPIVSATFLDRTGTETPAPWVPPAARFVLALASVVALVPPLAIAIVVAFHVPVVTVPRVVMVD